MEPGTRSVNFSTVSEWNDKKVRRLRDSLVGEEPLQIRAWQASPERDHANSRGRL